MNKPGSEVEELRGGVAGGSILRGVLRVGQEIEIRPGLVSKDDEGKLACQPIFSRIVSLFAEQNDLMYAVPGGLIGVGTKVDPTLCRADRMVGQVLGAVGHLPSIYTELEVSLSTVHQQHLRHYHPTQLWSERRSRYFLLPGQLLSAPSSLGCPHGG